MGDKGGRKDKSKREKQKAKKEKPPKDVTKPKK